MSVKLKIFLYSESPKKVIGKELYQQNNKKPY